MTHAAAESLADFYATLTPRSLARLADFYAPDARFVDPFNDVTGVDAIERIFRHMFATVDDPRFEVTSCLARDQEAMLAWTFRFGSGQAQCEIRGVTQLCFDGAGRVVEHIDHWDPARQLYERIPFVGAILRALRRRLSAP
ncbi:nuclear transport factor 2 family protein [Aromatoleum petrolei]|uniref:Nuclear transport factor 2 family protein n=1 Tax=Aromatoleum petrolei TaxID=76116 RepID=A0ABX1MHK1_9RHOO|nr:nuclear transport factor 2 family protein [Aromatoleum petrolei]NMF87410.1 nuclear transport factor 2 family protein [Aromatoleum petrolei]QTQ35776.1 SnoaL-like domain-containing protein [Aromatoleum petrolei]